jgi:thiamine-monophosphate kinase
MDVSDGLAGDLAKMMRVSGASAMVELDAIPISAAARTALEADPRLLDRLATGGDDYEILCTVPGERLARFLAAATAAGVEAVAIGTVRGGEGLPVFRNRAGERRYEQGSFTHF